MKLSQSFATLMFGVLLISPSMLKATTASSFNFVSGSTGADGILTLSETDCPAANTEITINVGASGIKNYESISIHANCIVKFSPAGNYSSPVRLVVQNNVVIDGQLNLNGTSGTTGSASVQAQGGQGGPGGYNGGNGGSPIPAGISANSVGMNGFGPGGGAGGASTSSGTNGSLTPSESNPINQPLVGGSGGGGGSRYNNTDYYVGGGGGGGGGALFIATSGKITINGTLSSMGAIGGKLSYVAGGAGGNGMFHLIANSIDGSGTINSSYAILETLDYLGTIGSNGALNVITFQQLALNQGPTLAITSIDSQPVTPGVGVTLTHSGDIQVGVTATNLPAGTQVTLSANGESRTKSTTTITLDNNGGGSGTLSIVSGVSLVTAYISGFIAPTTANLSYHQEPIVTARLEATPGNHSTMTFYTQSGIPVPPQVARELNLAQHVRFGMN